MGRAKSGAPHGTPPAIDRTFGGTKCGAKLKQGPGHCKRSAGYNTDHLGEGKCHLHGGATPIKHGRYSKVKRKDLRQHLAELAADPNAMDMRAELDLMRALVRSMLDRKKADPVAEARLLAEATKIVERMERIKNANAISHKDLGRVMFEMGRVVEALVEDKAVCEKIRDAWLTIRMA
ncbi:MAG: hypothetical protein ABI629_16310 [bacterium]